MTSFNRHAAMAAPKAAAAGPARAHSLQEFDPSEQFFQSSTSQGAHRAGAKRAGGWSHGADGAGRDDRADAEIDYWLLERFPRPSFTKG